jgi:hypothetical protein
MKWIVVEIWRGNAKNHHNYQRLQFESFLSSDDNMIVNHENNNDNNN